MFPKASVLLSLQRVRSGTTAVVAVIVEQTLHIAWLGDSQVLLVKNGLPVTVSVRAVLSNFVALVLLFDVNSRAVTRSFLEWEV